MTMTNLAKPWAYFPLGQASQDTRADENANVPGRHTLQRVAPVVLPKVPGRHLLQRVAPVALPNSPIGHTVQAKDPETFPNVPAAHCWHCVDPVDPVASTNVPTGQDVQLTLPAASW